MTHRLPCRALALLPSLLVAACTGPVTQAPDLAGEPPGKPAALPALPTVSRPAGNTSPAALGARLPDLLRDQRRELRLPDSTGFVASYRAPSGSRVGLSVTTGPVGGDRLSGLRAERRRGEEAFLASLRSRDAVAAVARHVLHPRHKLPDIVCAYSPLVSPPSLEGFCVTPIGDGLAQLRITAILADATGKRLVEYANRLAFDLVYHLNGLAPE